VLVELLGNAYDIFQADNSAWDIPRVGDNLNNPGGSADAASDEILHKCGVNNVDNLFILRFNLKARDPSSIHCR
jgi:hypothetical protein